MAIDQRQLVQIVHQIADELGQLVAGYGDQVSVEGIVLLTRVRFEPTEAEPIATGQTLILARAEITAPDEQAIYLRGLLHDALKQIPHTILDPSDLPPL